MSFGGSSPAMSSKREATRVPRGVSRSISRVRTLVAARRLDDQHVQILGRPPVAAADLEPGRPDPANAVAAEADDIVRPALVDHQPEVADRRSPAGAGGEDVAHILLADIFAV